MSFYQQKQPDLSLKKNAQIAHAQRRFKERLGVEVDIKALAKQIQRGESRFLSRESRRISHHLMTVEDRPVEIVYDNNRKVIITVLFPETPESS